MMYWPLQVPVANIRAFLVKNKVPILIGLVLFVIAIFLRLWRFSSAPDVFGDEVLYNQISLNLIQHGQLVAFGKIWFVHPPLYNLAQSVFFWMEGINQVTLSNTFISRLLASLCASFIILVVFIWITRMSNYKIGAVAALLTMFEPYALKYSRIGILESMTILFMVTSLYYFWKANSNGSLKKYIVPGVFFGLALLTKELAVSLFISIALWWLLTRYILKEKVNAKGVFIFLGTGVLMYLGYVIWALHVDAAGFLQIESVLLRRALGLINDTGYTNPNYIPFMTDFMETAHLYIATYVLLAISPFACVYLIWRERNQTSVLLSSWLVGSTIFFIANGIRNPQFFTYITVPAAVIDGYALSKIYLESLKRQSKKLLSYFTAALLAVLVLFNAGVWYNLYGIGTDNTFSQSVLWIEANIPKNTEIVAIDTYAYFLGDYKLDDLRTLDAVKGKNIHYFITSPRWTYMLDNTLFNYITTNGKEVGVFYGRSAREIDVYYVENPS